MDLLTTASSTDTSTRSRIAVLPVGSFEQHGPYLPLATDTMVACILASEIAARHDLWLLPPVTIGCSHEHAAWKGTVSIPSDTLARLIRDIAASARSNGADALVVVNGHGGNYVLKNLVQEANVDSRARMTLFPTSDDWDRARQTAGLETSAHEDMHAGELEVSILLHAMPDVVRPGYETTDHLADRPHLLSLGMSAYTNSGVIGRPSLGSAEKGAAVVEDLAKAFDEHLRILADRPSQPSESPLG
ncbi:MAG: creatininase family protein [Nocardioides sp.]